MVQPLNMTRIQETYTSQTSGIAEKTSRLTDINRELEQLKNEMEERGQAISDGKPIQHAKRAIAQDRDIFTVKTSNKGLLVLLKMGKISQFL